ncbi:MAG: tetratricopeptide repeat protein [Desulfobacterales bacterium]|nr:tetratricopeptide repeat protein [Desulfobacterales bacterium]
MAHKKKFRILITLIITMFIFTLPAGALAASVDDGWQLIDEGIRLYHKSDFYGAAKKWEKALRIFEEHNFKKGISAAIGNLGVVYWNLGQYQKALNFYENALAIKKEIGDRKGEGGDLGNIGNVYADLGQYQKALGFYEKALAIKKEIGDRKGEGNNLTNIGNVYKNLGQYQKALKFYEKALTIKKEIGDRNGEGDNLTNIGVVYGNLGQYQKALAYFEKALKIKKEIGDRNGEGLNLGNIGVVYTNLGQYQKALKFHEKALTIKKEIGDRNGEGDNLTNIGNVYKNLGQYQKALKFYEKALTIKKEIGDRNGEGDNLTNIGVVYGNLGQYQKALAYFEKALKIKKEIGDRKGESADLTNIGTVYADLGQYRKALSYYEKALTIHKEIGVPTGIVECNIGDIYLETGNTDRAEEIYKKAGGPIRLGRLCLVRKDFPKSLEYFQKALKQTLKGRNAAFLFVDYVGLGLSSEGLSDYNKARDFYLKALELTEEMRDSLAPGQKSHFFATKTMGFSRLEPYEGLIRVLNQLKEKEPALYYAEYTKARLFAESIAARHEGLTFRLPPTLAADEQEIANQIAALYKQREKAYSENRMEAYENIDKEIKAKKEKQRRLISKIRENYPEYASIKYPQPVKASEIPLNENEYLIEYEVTDTATFAWLVHDGKIVKSLTIPISRKDLAELVRKYRAYFQVSRKSDLTGFDPKTGHKLYTLLMKDILNVVPKEGNIIIVPDEILGVLPFEALVSEMPKRYQMAEGKKGPFPLGIRYVGDERNISYCQSATSLAVMRSLRKETRAKKPMLVLADPVFNVADVRVQGKTYLAKVTDFQMNLMRAVEDEGGFLFPRLEETSVLAKRLDKIFDNRIDVLEGLNASYARLKKHNLKDYRYLVFATHGILDNQVPGIREPALVLTQVGNPEDEDGFLTMSEVMDLSLDAKCSALTACETGLGRNISGEGVMGMGRAFQYAGSRSVLVSLWSVAEESTTKLAERFFYYLKIGKTNQQALKLARVDIRRDGYEHPFYWAPFILIGE